jgi:hypothetical protein
VRQLRRSQPSEGNLGCLTKVIRQHGYLYMPKLLPFRDVNEVAGRLAQILSRGCWVDDVKFTARRRVRLRRPPRLMSPQVYAEMQSCEAVHSLIRQNVIREVVEALLGPALIHPQVLLRAYRPLHAGGPSDPSVHRDYPAWRIPDMLTVWIPLTECPPARGGLCILEGSHRDTLNTPSALSRNGWASAHYNVGDVLFFHCYTVHGTLPNISNAARISADSRWQSVAEAVPAWACEPDGGSDWVSYTEGWECPSLVQPPRIARITSDSRPWDRLNVLPPSRLLGDLD